MIKTISKFFQKNKFFKRKTLASLLIISTILTFLPFQSAQAGLLGKVKDIFNNIVNLPINIAILLSVAIFLINNIAVALVLAFIYALLIVLLDSFIQAGLNIGISPSNVNTPGIIVNGWNFTLDFVNMFFVLTLTFIGLATILKIKEYEAQKLLPKLLAIAILVNFTPVIIGFIVDMGNLASNFFVTQIIGESRDLTDILADSLGSLDWTGIKNYFSNSLSNLWGTSFLNNLIFGLEIIIEFIVAIIYYLAAIYIYICINLVVLLRICMLWLLTILSPIAFFSYIFPQGSPFKRLFPGILSWEKWWEEFLKWVIVLIPFLLFLYIARGMLYSAEFSGFVPTGVGQYSISEIGATIDISSLLAVMNNLLPHFMSLLILYKGYKIGLEAAPEMAKSVVKSAENVAKTGVKAAATYATGGLAGAASGALGSMAGGIESAASAGGVKGALAKGAKGLGLTRGLRKGQTRLTQVAAKNKPQIISGFKDMSFDDQFAATQGISSRVGKRKKLEHYKQMDWSKASEDQKATARDFLERTIDQKEGKFTLGNLEQYNGVLKKMQSSGVTSAKIRVALASDPEKAKQELQEQVDYFNQLAKDNDDLKAEIEREVVTRYGHNATNEQKEEYRQNLAAESLSFSEASRSELRDKSSKEITSLAGRLGSHKMTGRQLTAIRDGHSLETFGKFFGDENHQAIGSINDAYGGENFTKLMDQNPQTARYLLNNKNGKKLGFKAPDSIKKADGSIDYQEAIKKFQLFKAIKDANPETVKTPKGVYLSEDEIENKAQEVETERSTVANANDPNYQYNAQYIDSLLDSQGITPGTGAAQDWLNKNLDRAEAKRRLIEEKQKQLSASLTKEEEEALKKQILQDPNTGKRIELKATQERLSKKSDKLKEKYINMDDGILGATKSLGQRLINPNPASTYGIALNPLRRILIKGRKKLIQNRIERMESSGSVPKEEKELLEDLERIESFEQERAKLAEQIEEKKEKIKLTKDLISQYQKAGDAANEATEKARLQNFEDDIEKIEQDIQQRAQDIDFSKGFLQFLKIKNP